MKRLLKHERSSFFSSASMQEKKRFYNIDISVPFVYVFKGLGIQQGFVLSKDQHFTKLPIKILQLKFRPAELQSHIVKRPSKDTCRHLW
jgi:hypothetical protein